MTRTPVCAIVGRKATSPHWTQETAAMAYFAGQQAVFSGYAVLTGGLGGVMAEAARGAKAAEGVTLGVLPGLAHAEANPYIDFVLPSGIGIARNALTAAACDVMVALPGGSGTMEEMLFALDFGRTVISFGGPQFEGVEYVEASNYSGLVTLLHHVKKPAGV